MSVYKIINVNKNFYQLLINFFKNDHTEMTVIITAEGLQQYRFTALQEICSNNFFKILDFAKRS